MGLEILSETEKTLYKVIASREESIKNILLAYGNTRDYWCNHCKGHVSHGHLENCNVIADAISIFGKQWVMDNIHVQEWDNYAHIAALLNQPKNKTT